VAEDGGAFGDK